MLVLTIVTVLQFWQLMYKMLARASLSLWHCVTDNVVFQTLRLSINCLYTNSKSTILRPLKGEVGHELSASKLLNSDSSSSGFLLSNCLLSLMVLLSRPSFPSLHGWQCYCISMFICYILPSNAFTFAFPKLFVHIFNRESLWDAFWDFCASDFSKSIGNNNHSRIIYCNDDTARLVKT